MKLFLKNIGKIQEATVEINGITVIAGENNTGKSTIGKTLYSIFNSFYEIEKQIRLERVQSIKNLLGFIYLEPRNILNSKASADEVAEEIVENSERCQHDTESLKKLIWDIISHYNKDSEKNSINNSIEDLFQRIIDVLKVPNEEILKTVLNKKLDVEFNGQVNNLFAEEVGCIELQIKNQVVSIEVTANSVTKLSSRVDLRTEAVYLDDPFILDEQKFVSFFNYFPFYADHKTHLRSKLFTPQKELNVINEIVAANKFEKIYEKINAICSGDIVKKGRINWGYKKANTDKIFEIKNISTGLKTFVILKTLLINGTIEANGTIILDEPEIHLHPEWQLLFAELIVLIQKEFDMHILLNTHSPYFLRAIQVYSAKYEIADRCNYYLSELCGDQALISDVTSEIDKIYRKLSHPLQQLEDGRWNDV